MTSNQIARWSRRAGLLAALLLTACGPETAEGPAHGAPSQAAGPEAVAESEPVPEIAIPETGIAPVVLGKWTGDLDGMIERRYIRVLTPYSKTHFFIDQGTARGLVPDSFKLFEDDLDKRLENEHLRIAVVFVPVAYDELVPALLEGRGDIVAAGKAPVRVRPAPEVLSDEDMLEMVAAGLVPATLVADDIAGFWQQIFPGIVLHPEAAVRTGADAAMMVRKNSPQLLAELNAFLARYPQGSLTRNVLLKKYLKDVKYAKSATSEAEIRRFREVIDLMRKYGDQYGLDYLLMAAQGYQESGLDHGRRSHVGALGVMQVMPKTGAELKVGDIRQLEPNIHAGVKYIRFMMDRYYADEPMTDLDKALFTFASYNAGPARIRQLREKARARGLNPDKWFNNVEVIAAESIGRETVQYVSNIYKYYLAYQMVAEQLKNRDAAKEAA